MFRRTARPRPAPLLVMLLGLWFAACDDPFAAFLGDVPLTPSEVTLYDFVSGKLEDPPAFDLLFGVAARVDQTSNWDFLLRFDGDDAELVPFTAATDSVSDSGLQTTTDPFSQVLEAPEEGYMITEPLAVEIGMVILARSRVDPTNFLGCSRYAKLEILAIDPAEGKLIFQHLINPNCGDTVLEPGKHGSL